MGKITVPPLPHSITRKRADALVAYIAANFPTRSAYSHGWGNDWGVTISSRDDSNDELTEIYQSLLDLELI